MVKPWVDSLSTEWPGPIAHEYHRLREAVDEQSDRNAVAAAWQLKDTAEVLIKLPVLAMARDAAKHLDLPEVAAEVRGTLLNRPSMGHWLGLADRLAKAILESDRRETLVLPGLPLLFRNPREGGKPKQTPLIKLLDELVEWRNEQLGHGAMGVDHDALWDDLLPRIESLNLALAEAATADPWGEARFHLDAGETLHGHESILKRHQSDGGQHETQMVGLRFSRRDPSGGDRSIDLSPYVAARRCSVCSKLDVFFFNSFTRGKSDSTSRFAFLDYLAGHATSRPGFQEASLLQELQRLDEDGGGSNAEGPDEDAASLDGPAIAGTLQDLLDAAAVERDILPPRHLIDWASGFLNKHDGGVLWLLAPGHTGKSVFAGGIAHHLGGETGQEPSLQLDPEGEVGVMTFHIKREHRCFSPQFREALHGGLIRRELLDLRAQREDLPRLDTDADNPAAALVDLLKRLRQRAGIRRADRKIVICLDGLDELRPPDEAPDDAPRSPSILDYIPKPHDLPEGFFILLTSRPQEDCPKWMWQAMQERVEGHAELGTLELSTEHPDYRSLLRDYFNGKLIDRYTQMIANVYGQHLDGVAPTRHGEAGQQAWASLSNVQQAAAKRVWKDLCEQRGRADAGPRPLEPLADVVRQMDRLFEQVLDRGEGRFLYVSHLVNLLADRELALDAVEGLPRGEALFELYLGRLERALPPKLYGLAKRVLLVLAAEEEAYDWDVNIQPPGYADPEWKGLPLNILAGLLDGLWAEAGGLSPRLVFVLYTLKQLLSTHKAEAADHTRYRLGLKGLTATLRERWLEELQTTHRRLAETFLLDWGGRWQELPISDPAVLQRLARLPAHVEQAADDAGAAFLTVDLKGASDALQRVQQTLREQSQHRKVTRWLSLEMKLIRQWKESDFNPVDRYLRIHAERGTSRSALGDLYGALKDYGDAIRLYEALQDVGDEAWPPKRQRDLAVAYTNRSTLFRSGGDSSGAMKDSSRALMLMNRLRERLGDAWPPKWQNDLAAAYINRAAAFRAHNESSEAVLKDCNRAVKLREHLRDRVDRLGEAWPPQWQNDLASAYINRGNACMQHGKRSGVVKDVFALCATACRTVLEPVVGSRTARLGAMLCHKFGPYSALKDYSRAIMLMDHLRQRLGEAWQPEWQNELAIAYANRGTALEASCDSSEAVENYDHAIMLMDRLRERLGEDWPLDWQESLALTCVNRGMARELQGDTSGAMHDYSRSVDLLKPMQKSLAKWWPPEQSNESVESNMRRDTGPRIRDESPEAVENHDPAARRLRCFLENIVVADDGKKRWHMLRLHMVLVFGDKKRSRSVFIDVSRHL